MAFLVTAFKNSRQAFHLTFAMLSELQMPTLKEFEDKLLAGRVARAEAIDKLVNILSDVAACKRTLELLKSEVENFKENCNTAKAVGTTVTATGVALSICKLIT